MQGPIILCTISGGTFVNNIAAAKATMLSDRRQAMIWINADVFPSGLLGTQSGCCEWKYDSISIDEYAFENIVCKMTAILFQF